MCSIARCSICNGLNKEKILCVHESETDGPSKGNRSILLHPCDFGVNFVRADSFVKRNSNGMSFASVQFVESERKWSEVVALILPQSIK